MAAIGKLVVTLTARTGKFRKGLSKAGSRVKSFAAGIGGAAKRAAKFGAVMAGVAAAGLVIFTKRAFGSIDAVAKLSRQIGISIDGLRGLKRAAEITGAGEAALTKGLGFLTKALGEARTGIGEGKQALEALGLSADDLAEIPLEQAIGQIADSMNNLETQSDKAFVASKLFGRGGLALVNTLALGSEGLEEMAAGAVTLQGSLSAFDAGKVEDANDAITDLRSVWTSFFERIAVRTAPFIKRLAESISKVLIFFRDNASKIVPRVLNFFKSILAGAVVLVNGIWDNVKKIPDFFRITALQTILIWEKFKTMAIVVFKTLITDIKGAIDFVPTFFKVAGEKAVEFFLKGIGTLVDGTLRGFAFIAEKVGATGFADKLRNVGKNVFDDYARFAKGSATVADKAWGDFMDRTGKRGEGLRVQVEKINKEFAAVKSGLIAKQAELLAGGGGAGGGGFASQIADIIEGIRGIELPATALMAAAGEAGKEIGGEIKKATGIGPAGAIERGTVQAFSANVRSLFSNLANSGKKTAERAKEMVREQKKGNNLLTQAIGQTQTVSIEG